jgi:hypothetical protein
MLLDDEELEELLEDELLELDEEELEELLLDELEELLELELLEELEELLDDEELLDEIPWHGMFSKTNFPNWLLNRKSHRHSMPAVVVANVKPGLLPPEKLFVPRENVGTSTPASVP